MGDGGKQFVTKKPPSCVRPPLDILGPSLTIYPYFFLLWQLVPSLTSFSNDLFSLILGQKYCNIRLSIENIPTTFFSSRFYQNAFVCDVFYRLHTSAFVSVICTLTAVFMAYWLRRESTWDLLLHPRLASPPRHLSFSTLSRQQGFLSKIGGSWETWYHKLRLLAHQNKITELFFIVESVHFL